VLERDWRLEGGEPPGSLNARVDRLGLRSGAAMSESPYSSVDASGDPASLVAFLDTAAVGLGAMKRYVAHRISQYASGPVVVDIGCGAGHDLELLRAEGLAPVGVDPSVVMLGAVRERGGVGTLVRAIGARLPFADGSIDGCRAERVLMHVDDPAAVVLEAARVLRSGGVFAAFEPDWASLWFESTMPGAEEVMSRLSPCRWPGIGSQLVRLAEDAGFEVVEEVTEVSRGTRLGRIPLDVVGRVERRIAEGSIDEAIGRAWLDEQRHRDIAGQLQARWTKQLVVALRP